MFNIRNALSVTILIFAVSGLSAVATAQENFGTLGGRVSTATVPIPMPDHAEHPLLPGRLRAESPWTLSLTGDWRFKLTRGRIVDGHFATSSAETAGVRVSSTEAENVAANAFDNDPETRWCASSGTFPQFIEAKLDTSPRIVTGVAIQWERSGARYRCRIDGGDDGVHWRTLIDRSAGEGIGNGLISLPQNNSAVRYVRLVVIGATSGSWASIRELGIHYRIGEKDIIWHPAPESNAPPPHSDDFVATTFDDRGWNHLAVPSNWEMAGYSIPTYNSVDDSVGLYRRWITVPHAWMGRKIIWHFDGALDGAEIFINGTRAGYHESGYTAFDVDLTGLVHPGERNLLAVRVCKSTPSVDCETGDYQCMGGIYRDTRLIAIPATHVADLAIRTPLIDNYRDAMLNVLLRVNGSPRDEVTVTGHLWDAATQRSLPVPVIGSSTIGRNGSANIRMYAKVIGPKLWSAESPSLYYLTCELQVGGKHVERVEQRFGFRQVEIKNNIVLWNGKPIKCAGICRHDFWPDKGFALTDAEWRKDLTLMKDTNINAIRTSHYNHAARFLELCDERGFYILDEVPFCWVGDKVKDPKFAPALLQRTAETVARDNNRPCILAWSLGNENPVGIDTQQVHDLVTKLDPTRPSFASGAGPHSVKGQQLFDTHYPSPGDITRYLERDAKTAPEVITEHPHTFYSRETQTYDPGASDAWSEGLIATWQLLWRSPTILGSFIWEWQSQGIADHFPDHTTDFYYGLDHMRQENNKGIMDAYRHPKPEQWIVKNVYSPIQIAAGGLATRNDELIVRIVNRYSFTDLSELKVNWTAFRGHTILASGSKHLPCPPGESTESPFPTPGGTTLLELRFDRADGSNVIVTRLSPPGTLGTDAPEPAVDPSPLTVRDTANSLEIFGAKQQLSFDKRTGLIRRWLVAGKDRLRPGGPALNLGGEKTASGDNYFRSSLPPVTDNAMVSSLNSPDGSIVVTVKSQISDATGSKAKLGVLTVQYTVRPSAEIAVHWQLEWSAASTNLWEAGLCIPLPKGLDHQTWLRDSYFTAYPVGHIGAPSGSCGPKDIAFRSSKRGLHFLTLTEASGAGVALIAKQVPLIGRARSDKDGVTLFASREIAAAGPDDLSQSWFHSHDIHGTPGKPLSGEFVLRAINAP